MSGEGQIGKTTWINSVKEYSNNRCSYTYGVRGNVVQSK